MQRILSLLAIFALIITVACGGNSNSSSNNGSNNSGSGSGTNSGSNPGSGGGSGTGSGGGASQAGTYVYIANKGAGTISIFRLASDGSLTASGTPVASSGAERLAAVSNRFLVATDPTGLNLRVFSINQSSGVLSPVNSTALQSPPRSIAADSSKSLVYAATDNGIYGFTVSSSGLTPLAGSPYFANPAGQDPRSDKQARSVLVDPSGKFLFAGFGGYHGSGFIAAISRDASGALTTEQVAVADGPSSLAALWNGSILYGDNPVLGFHVAGSGALTPIAGGPVLSGEHLASDTTGHYLLSTEEGFNGNGKVHVYSVDQSSGFATEVSGSPFSSQGVGPSMVRLDPSGTYAIVLNGSNNVSNAPSNNIVVFKFDSGTGALTQVGSPTVAGSLPTDLAFATVSGS